MSQELRNIAIIAHVDHGKTTLVDKLLQQSGTLDNRKAPADRIMDTDDLEKERGITILSKNTALDWQGCRINIIDTPGHADFGGEVERILSMADSVLLVVDAVDGPMPQTRFVTHKAFEQGLNPIVVVNKIDREGAQPDWVVEQVFDLFDQLGASDEQLDFPVIYASAIQGFATTDHNHPGEDMTALFKAIINEVPAPSVDPDKPFQMQISQLDYSDYVGTMGVGRITAGTAYTNMPVTVVGKDGKTRNARIMQILGYQGLKRHETKTARAGDIVCISGIAPLRISETLCAYGQPNGLPTLSVDEPTISMMFQINDSPLAGKDGKYVTSRQIAARLDKELLHNVALRVDETESADKFKVSGRGELHLSILLENMRREGYEISVSRPEVILKTDQHGQILEPYEEVTIDVEESYQGNVMEKLGARQGEITNMVPDGQGRIKLEYLIPSRGLIGFYSEFLSATSGTGIMTKVFSHYGLQKGRVDNSRRNGALISMNAGITTAYALFNLQSRGTLFIGPQTEVYEGMIIGRHARENDLVVNAVKGKQLTNVRASGKDEALTLNPPATLTLESALDFIADDELVEITPHHLRVRKKHLSENARKRAGKDQGMIKS